ncbi:splicing regulatory glutamine/lysine-rich protein 1 isoform X1 [Oncorhynchus kisutch]|uniref:Splicing regulatory glutamine/lysine-rich protein 1 n=1 Tax=Oncorhynchus kisutch TaxID=8019 RepID=A0A8C7NB93_ONCKI|nr:splicing regulatory glutamine/lysine-rich protein 1 isoform X1 [Oncorhynchus kisutch]
MSGIPGTAVIQITNLSSAVSSEQMRTLFGFLGDVEELRLYPPDNAPLPFSSKVCYIKYREPSSVGVAQHLTNTVFIDRALIVVPCAEGKIPEEAKALSLLAPAAPPAVPAVPSLMPGAGLLPLPTSAPIQTQLSVPIVSLAALPAALDPAVSALAVTGAGGVSSSAQPPLMGNVDPSKVNEIRRTVYVGNLNSQTTTAEQLLEFFKQVGDVKFVRMAGDETQPTRFAFVEFADQDSVSRALTFNGVMFGDRPLKINHSNNAIVKPPELTPQAAAKELEDVMKRVREAQSTIAAIIVEPEEVKKRSSSHSRRSRRSRTRSRSHSRSRTRRKRSHSRHRSRLSQRSRPKVSESHVSRGIHKRLSRSRSRDRRKEREQRTRGKEDISRVIEDRRQKEKKAKTPPKSYSASQRSRSTSRGHRRKSRDRSRSPRRKARSPSPKRGRKDEKREKARDGSREKRESSNSRKKSSRDKEKIELKAKPMKVERDYDRKEKDYQSDREGSATPSEGLTSPCIQHNGSYNTNTEDDAASLADSTE